MENGLLLSRRGKTPRCLAHGLLFIALAAVLFAASGQSQPADSPETVRRHIPIGVAPPVESDAASDAAALEPVSATSTGDETASATSAQAVAAEGATTTAPSGDNGKTPSAFYDLWVLAPAIVAILLAIVTRQVVPSLFLGILTAGAMLCHLKGIRSPVDMLVKTFTDYILGVFIPSDFADTDRLSKGYDRLQVIAFTQLIGGMIGIMEANGGTRAMVARVTHMMKNARRGQLGALLGGVIIFFDDYANALILGPAMRPVFDRLKLSRAKLAYIVDSTAAPVASLFIGTWLAAEINFLDSAFDALGENRPEFLRGMNGSSAFWGSLPYRTYAWLTLFFVFMIGLTGRDFGPMRKAEAETLAASSNGNDRDAERDGEGRYWYLGFLPVFTLVFMTVLLLILTGCAGCKVAGIQLSFATGEGIWMSIQSMLAKANSYTALLYSGLAAVTVAVITSVLSRRIGLSKTMDAMTGGMQRIFGAQIILILAWGLASSVQDLQLGEVARLHMQRMVDEGSFAIPLLPTVIFLTACIISFATGTSWGTMGILCPTTIAISAGLLHGLPPEQAMPIFYASVGAVLTGAVFGDHCSPISDTTVLSAMASECDLTLHVRTQLPYSVIVAGVGLVCTDLLDWYLIANFPAFYADYWNVFFGTGLAAILLALVVLTFGRKRPLMNWNPPERPAPAMA